MLKSRLDLLSRLPFTRSLRISLGWFRTTDPGPKNRAYHLPQSAHSPSSDRRATDSRLPGGLPSPRGRTRDLVWVNWARCSHAARGQRPVPGERVSGEDTKIGEGGGSCSMEMPVAKNVCECQEARLQLRRFGRASAICRTLISYEHVYQ